MAPSQPSLADASQPPLADEWLAGHRLITTRDLDDARQRVANVFCPHRLSLGRADSRLNLRHNRVLLGDVGLNYIDYGCEVHITPGVLQHFYLVQIPLSGGSEVTSNGVTVQSDPTTATVPNPTEHLSMTWQDRSPHFVVYVSREAVERTMEGLLGRPLRVPLRFRLDMDLSNPGVGGWRELVELLRRDAESDVVCLHPTVRRQIEEAVVTGLLTVQPHNLSDGLERGVEPACPRSVRQVMRWCEESPEETGTVGDLAARAGVSVRSLQEGFRRYVGLSPTQYLREVRLRRVREELLANAAGRPVSEVAYTWGFTNLGRFARHYRDRFGELPSETRRTGG